MSVLKKILPIDDLVKTVWRFPRSALCSLVLFLLSVLSIHDVIDLGDEAFGRIMTALVYGFFWFGLAQMIVEGAEDTPYYLNSFNFRALVDY